MLAKTSASCVMNPSHKAVDLIEDGLVRLRALEQIHLADWGTDDVLPFQGVLADGYQGFGVSTTDRTQSGAASGRAPEAPL